jgi:hypothetical protein
VAKAAAADPVVAEAKAAAEIAGIAALDRNNVYVYGVSDAVSVAASAPSTLRRRSMTRAKSGLGPNFQKFLLKLSRPSLSIIRGGAVQVTDDSPKTDSSASLCFSVASL